MRNKLLLSVILCALAGTAFFTFDVESKKDVNHINNTIVTPVSNPVDDIFLIGVMNGGRDDGYNRLTDELHTNIWCRYTDPWSDIGWTTFHNNYTAVDLLNADIGDYDDYVLDVLDENHTEGMKTLMHRIKIEYLSYGQRSDYEAVNESYYLSNDAYGDYRFYTYNTSVDNNSSIDDITDNTSYGNGALVKKCSTGLGISSETLILEDLKTNREQCATYGFSSDYMRDSPHSWYVKPSIRIDSAFAANILNQNVPVCKIVVLNFDGDTIKVVTLRVANFKENGSYDGSYIEEFFDLDPDSLLFISDGSDFNPNGGSWEQSDPSDPGYSQADFKVYWSGQCDMWIDYVRVDNEIAHRLLKGNDLEFENWLSWEVEDLAVNGGYSDDLFRFYIEEFEFNNRPCMKYVNEKIKSLSGGKYSLMCNPYWGGYNVHKPNAGSNKFTAEEFKRTLVDYVGLNEIFMGSYQMMGYVMNDDYFDKPVYVPNTLPESEYDVSLGRLCLAAPPDEYDDWLQEYMDDDYIGFEQDGQYRFYNETSQYLSKACDIPFYTIVQSHLWYDQDGAKYKEPTNEELKLLAYMPVTYGAKGLFYFEFVGYNNIGNLDFYSRGLTDPDPATPYDYPSLPVTTDLVPRHENVYEQFGSGQGSKYNTIGEINERLEKWGPTIMTFDYDNTNTYIYRLEEERNALLSSSYFQDIVTYKPGSGMPACVEDNPGGDAPPSYIYECVDDRYLQVATFKNPAEPSYNKYFMVVNRRCSPYDPGQGENGGQRKIKIKFKASALPEAVNWKLVDLDTGVPIVFSKLGGLVDLGSYLPGEGKLYKMIPVATDGGTLVDDEVITDDMIISDTVFTDGFNLTIEDGRTITFDTNGVIVAQGGNFTCGDISGTQGVDLIGTGEWNGIKLNGCDTVKIYNTNIEDIKDSAYAIDMYNCKNVEMEGNTFTLDNSGAVRGSYVFSFEFFTPNIVLYDNTVNMGSNTLPVFNFNANSASSFPVIIDGCDMNAPSSSSSSAISITNISGGVIKNNEITGYNTSVLALSSAMDFYNNIISSSTTDCILSGSSGSTLGLKETGGKGTGGENFFSTSHEDANNVEIYGGYFFAHDGYNTFDIAASYDDGKHFLGYFPEEDDGTPTLEYNCFTEDGSAISPVYDVTRGIAGDPITFIYTYDCTGGQGVGFSSKSENNYLIVPITERYNDTIKIREGNFTLTASDSMSVEMRKRNYGVTIGIAERILENSPGNPVAYDALNKLYLASLRLDSAGSKISPLKAFLEVVILDNGDKPGLVSRAFYFIQKCKAALGQYQSALTGFSDIITNNPNTYDALVASWDYAATTLLINGGGSGGNRPIINVQSSMFSEEEMFKLYSFDDDPDGKNDRSKLSKEQKQQVKVNVVKSFEETRKEEINVINKLKEKSDKGDRNATKELKCRETLQAVVTKRQPADIYEHINNVSSDIRVVFNSTDDNSIKKEQNSIPAEFELSQNFPNPFNPTTKIQYALPKDGKVQLIIYDILGREMAKLVNNEFKSAGRYVSEFNGGRLASGIYFYRIIVNDGKDFNSVKKMVLIK